MYATRNKVPNRRFIALLRLVDEETVEHEGIATNRYCGYDTTARSELLCLTFIVLIFFLWAFVFLSIHIEINALILLVAFNSENTIAAPVTYGWATMKNRIIVRNAVFVGLEVRKTFSTATIVECASTKPCTTTTIARVESTSQTARFARNSCLAPAAPLTKCRVATRYTGNASAS